MDQFRYENLANWFILRSVLFVFYVTSFIFWKLLICEDDDRNERLARKLFDEQKLPGQNPLVSVKCEPLIGLVLLIAWCSELVWTFPFLRTFLSFNE